RGGRRGLTVDLESVTITTPAGEPRRRRLLMPLIEPLAMETTTSAQLRSHDKAADHAQYAELAALAGGLAHEIKNPLSTIGLNLELLAEELQDPQSPREHRMLTKVQSVQRECEHLREILDGFLQFARAGELEAETADLNDIVRDFLDFFRPTA